MKQTIKRVMIGNREIILLGTAHISRESMEEVDALIRSEHPDRVCIELDDGRLASLENKKSWESLDIVKILKEKKGFLLLANLIMSSFQKRMGSDVGVKPGEEMKMALNTARELEIPFSLVDRPITVTLRRAWACNNLWGKAKLMAALISSAFSKEELSAEEVENLKEQSAMDTMMDELADYMPIVKKVLIDERDQYLATKIFTSEGTKVIAVLGAGHLPGVESWLLNLQSGVADADVSAIDTVPKGGIGSKIAGWIFPAFIVAMIVAGFITGGKNTSLEMLLRWFLWNGSLAAFGSLIAFAHPLTIIVTFLGAPLGTANPFLAVGLFAGLTEAWLHKPQVTDMEKLSDDVMTLKGWYKNRIAHVLLIFFLSSLGGSIGNFISIPALAGKLFS